MSHLKEYDSDVASPDGRSLGDEWVDWDGRDGKTVREGKGTFLLVSGIVIVLMNALLCFSVYMMSPRLAGWRWWLPEAGWFAAALLIIISAIFMSLLVATIVTEKNFLPSGNFAHFMFDLVFSRVIRIGKIFGISRDRMGHSFVKVSNSLSHATKPKDREEKLLILLPRCLSKDNLKGINALKEIYPLDVLTVSGGELARKKVKEMKPTAVIGVACERDLVSGIRDVGKKISVIGIPNERPEGPCKNTHIDMKELIGAIEFYVGPQRLTSNS